MELNINKILIKSYLSLMFFCGTYGAHAQDLTPMQQEIFATVTAKVMSPYCPGKLLSDCPSGKASELKSILRNKLISGSTESELMTYLEDQYGKETIESAPGIKGFAAVAWVTPFAFLLVGAYLFWRWLKNWSCTPNNIIDDSANTSDLAGDSLSDVAARAKKELGL